MSPRLTAIVVASVAALGILSVLGVIVLAIVQHPIPDLLQNVAVGSLTGLVGQLLPSRAAEPSGGGGGDGPDGAGAP